MFGPVARFTVLPSRQLAPYLVAGGGGAWLHTVSLSNGISLTQGGYYLSVGGGANIYLGRNWGIRPEVRYSWQRFNRAETIGYSASSFSRNDPMGSVGIFYQFGGKGAHGD
jgi:hypothetical protein